MLLIYIYQLDEHFHELTRSIMIFAVRQPRNLIRHRSMLLSELFYFEMLWKEMHWIRVFYAEKHHCRYIYYYINFIISLQSTVCYRLSAKNMIYMVTLILSLRLQDFIPLPDMPDNVSMCFIKLTRPLLR